MTRRFAWLFGIGLLLRLLALPLWGTFDTNEWKAWSTYAVKEGLAPLYGPPDKRIVKLAREKDPDSLLRGLLQLQIPRRNVEYEGVGILVDYPPASMLVLWAEGQLYRAIDPSMPSDRRFNAIINLAPLFGSLALALLLFSSAGPDRKLGEWRALAFWLNPAVFLASPVLGYQDPLFAAFGVAAVLALMQRRYGSAALLLAAAGLLKPQAVLLVPVFLVVLLRESGPRTWAKSAFLGLGLGALVLAPWWSQGYFLSGLDGGFRTATEYWFSALSMNLWWIAGYVMKWVQSGPWPTAGLLHTEAFAAWAGWNPVPISRALLLVGSGLALLPLVRGPRDDRRLIVLSIVLQVHVYAFFALAVHENHTLLGVYLAPLLLGAWRQARTLVVATTAFAFTNLLMALRFGEGITTRACFLSLTWLPLADALFMLGCLGHALLLVWLFRASWPRAAALGDTLG